MRSGPGRVCAVDPLLPPTDDSASSMDRSRSSYFPPEWVLVEEFWDIVKNGTGKDDKDRNGTYAARKLMHLKVKNYLFLAIDRSVFETILYKDSSKDIWDSMKTKYSGTTRVKRAQLQALRREFELLQMADGEKGFVDQPLGYVVKGGENKVYKLNRALYDFKQAPRA